MADLILEAILKAAFIVFLFLPAAVMIRRGIKGE